VLASNRSSLRPCCRRVHQQSTYWSFVAVAANVKLATLSAVIRFCPRQLFYRQLCRAISQSYQWQPATNTSKLLLLGAAVVAYVMAWLVICGLSTYVTSRDRSFLVILWHNGIHFAVLKVTLGVHVWSSSLYLSSNTTHDCNDRWNSAVFRSQWNWSSAGCSAV